MSIILEFILSICIFIYGIQLFSKGISNLVNEKAKNLLIKYTNTKFKGIILGTILTIIIQSSGIVTILTLSFVNSNLIDFSNTLGIIMGSNLGTCFTSWLTSFINANNFLIFLNPTFYTP
ncbi:MAG: Na/Pi symporter, partial [Erysipelotrichaceae bacterium]|nr:Na/Pi symporter [Erysipelotrichaceae bacterium]